MHFSYILTNHKNSIRSTRVSRQKGFKYVIGEFFFQAPVLNKLPEQWVSFFMLLVLP